MNVQEQKTLNELLKLATDLRTENAKFREDVNLLISTLNKKVEAKQLPITLEQDILRVAQQSIGEAIKSTMTGHSSPMTKLINSVVDEHSGELRQLISDSFVSVIRTEEFKQSIVSAFSHKVARTVISNNDGMFDRVSNELKQDSIFKSKMMLAVSNVVEECLKERK